VPISTAQWHKRKFVGGALPNPPADLFDSVGPPLVTVPNPADRRGVLTVCAVCLSGTPQGNERASYQRYGGTGGEICGEEERGEGRCGLFGHFTEGSH
jgi:hypothetical protein